MDERKWPATHPPTVNLSTRWPLAWTFWVDTLAIGVLLVLMNLGIGAFIVGRAIEQGVPLIQPDGGPDLEQFTQLLGTTGFFIVVLSQALIFIVVPLVRVSLLRRESLTHLGFQAGHLMHLVVQGLGLGILMLTLNIIVGIIFESLGIVQNQTDQFPLFQGDLAGNLIIVLAVVVLAPLGEEVLFRGYAFNAFLQQWGPLPAYLLSAFLFSIAHSLAATEGQIALLVPAFIIGLVLALGMHKTRSLVPCVVAHALNNAVAISVVIICANNPAYCQ